MILIAIVDGIAMPAFELYESNLPWMRFAAVPSCPLVKNRKAIGILAKINRGVARIMSILIEGRDRRPRENLIVAPNDVSW